MCEFCNLPGNNHIHGNDRQDLRFAGFFSADAISLGECNILSIAELSRRGASAVSYVAYNVTIVSSKIPCLSSAPLQIQSCRAGQTAEKG